MLWLKTRKLKRRLGRGTAVERLASAQELARIGREDILVAALAASDPDTGSTAAVALGRAHCVAAIAPLIRHLNDPDEHVCSITAEAIAGFGDHAVAALQNTMDQDCVSGAVRVLGNIGSTSAVGALQSVVDRTRTHRTSVGPIVRKGATANPPSILAIEQLQKIGSEAAVRKLVGIQNTAAEQRYAEELVEATRKALRGLGERASQPLLKMLGEEGADLAAIAQAFCAIGDSRGAEILTAVVRGKRNRRRDALLALAYFKDARVVDALTAVLSEDGASISDIEAAMSSIEAIGDRRASKALAELMRRV